MRDIDVKYRTGEIVKTNLVHGWREGMSEWKVISDIPEIKIVLEESSKTIPEIEIEEK